MLQVGVDCEAISRFRRLPYKRNERFYRRIFTPREIKYCISYRDPYPRFAVRFAAKEATVKALNNIARPFYTDIEVVNNEKKQPTIRISKNRFKGTKRLAISLSLTHSDCYAIAFTIVADNKHDIKETKRLLGKSASYAKRKIRRHSRSRH